MMAPSGGGTRSSDQPRATTLLCISTWQREAIEKFVKQLKK